MNVKSVLYIQLFIVYYYLVRASLLEGKLESDIEILHSNLLYLDSQFLRSVFVIAAPSTIFRMTVKLKIILNRCFHAWPDF